LVKPEDFIKENCESNLDCAILNHFYIMRNGGPYSAREITSALQHYYSCNNKHLFTLSPTYNIFCPICHEETYFLLNQKKDHAERTVRNRLSKLHFRDYLQETKRDATGKRGRSPKVYHLSNTFKARLENYLNKKELTLGSALRTAIRCNDPMECPDPNCKICANAGIKTRWD
jgi:uncharacterized Zn finger protein (UPF0148 family)